MTMVGVPSYAMTHLQATFAHVAMDTRLMQIGGLVMVSNSLHYVPHCVSTLPTIIQTLMSVRTQRHVHSCAIILMVATTAPVFMASPVTGPTV